MTIQPLCIYTDCLSIIILTQFTCTNVTDKQVARMTTWINPLRTAITASSDPQTFTLSVNSMETATNQPGPAPSVAPQTLTTPINSVGPATAQPGPASGGIKKNQNVRCHYSIHLHRCQLQIIIKLTSAFCYHIYSTVWHTFLITVQKQRHPRDPGTVSKEQRPPQQGKGICLFCQTFFLISNVTIFKFLSRQETSISQETRRVF